MAAAAVFVLLSVLLGAALVGGVLLMIFIARRFEDRNPPR